jgi:hypothetical protein
VTKYEQYQDHASLMASLDPRNAGLVYAILALAEAQRGLPVEVQVAVNAEAVKTAVHRALEDRA